MRLSAILATSLAVIALGLALPGTAAAQVSRPSGPLFIRLSGGFLVGERIANLESSQTVGGFVVVAGVALPIAHREDMEIQVEVSDLEYSGNWIHPGGSQSIRGRALGPTALYLYNFVRAGRGVMPFAGGGVNLAHTDDTVTREVANPFFQGTFESRTKDWEFNLEGAGGAQFASQSKVTFRAEGRLRLGTKGPLFLVLGGISF